MKAYRLLRTAAPFALAALSGLAFAAATDEKWEITTRMEMPGFQMPATTNVSCLPKNGAYQPDSGDKKTNCQMTDLKTSGNKITWKVRCTGKDEMTGIGEQTQSAGAMNGTIKITSRDMTMTQSWSGKLVGSCDAGAERAKIEGEVKASFKEYCDTTVESAWKTGGYEPKMPDALGPKGQCPGAKAAICAKATPYAGSYEGYGAYRNSKGWVAAACGIKLDAVRKTLCGSAGGEGNYGFLGHHCPAEAKALADKNCQGFGRGYTADAAHPNASMCRALRSASGKGGSAVDSDDGATAKAGQGGRAGAKIESSRDQTPQETPAPADDTATQAIDAAKKLKGLFGF